MPRTLIIGYGNPLRSDDGVGWRAAEELALSLDFPQVKVISCHQLTPELVDDMSQTETVIFIDAARGTCPGEIASQRISAESATIRSHGFSPAQLLSLTQLLYGTSPATFAITLTGWCFDHGMHLSEPVEMALSKLVAMVTESCQKCTQP
jgi:hydrogenase maturation protease